DMRDELMTGWLNSNIFVSQTTLASFTDIGFIAVPEPTGALLLLMGVAGIGMRRLRQGSRAA
ncbi:MAG TPA: peptidase, partial [Proteobacteria bacterium]|nr:peptidase [Pseudomonadota bacterium]